MSDTMGTNFARLPAHPQRTALQRHLDAAACARCCLYRKADGALCAIVGGNDRAVLNVSGVLVQANAKPVPAV
jgi:hypothetical protein